MRAHTNICKKLCDRAAARPARRSRCRRDVRTAIFAHTYIRVYTKYTPLVVILMNRRKNILSFLKQQWADKTPIYICTHIHHIISVGCVCVCGAGVDRLSLRALSTKNVLNYSKHTMKFIGRICVSVFLCYLACSGKICTNTLGCRMRA